MGSYESYMRSVTAICHTVTESMLSPVGRHLYESEHGYPPEQKLPGKGEDFSFEYNGFTGDVLAGDSTVRNLSWNGMGLTPNRIGAEPESFVGLPEAVFATYFDVCGEWFHGASQPDHPGQPPMKEDDMASALEQLIDVASVLRVTPTLEDLVDAIGDKNYMVAASFFDMSPSDLFSPGAGAELSGLFTNGDVHVVYHDHEIALLKPEYNHEARLNVLSQQAGPQMNVRIVGEPLEAAYVVGIDDTPVGLFGHTVDGTRLDVDQTVTREMINDVMGFDYSWDYETDVFAPAVGDRVRLQGDFAVEYVSRDVSTTETAGRLNMPIDNHLALFNNAVLSQGEDMSQEPVTVELPEPSVINIIHDEHRQVVSQFLPGTYRFYLLPRGLREASERPTWAEPQLSA